MSIEEINSEKITQVYININHKMGVSLNLIITYLLVYYKLNINSKIFKCIKMIYNFPIFFILAIYNF